MECVEWIPFRKKALDTGCKQRWNDRSMEQVTEASLARDSSENRITDADH